MLGKYEIVRKLAIGGMAEIYLARVRGSAGFEKLVVIKRILPTVADDPKFVQMFLEEARLAATLQHPNIADVYEVGEHEGSPFFAMEFVHGQDVRSMRFAVRDRKERIPLAIALAVVHGTASALDYAHDRTGPDGRNLGLVHRDVSASNILVSYEGAIKLIDFGIARASASTHQTQTGTLKGKIPYMSPEQCRGLPMDRRSDLFSLGVVMYELTVGQRPFRGENDFAIMDQIVHQHAPPPSKKIRNYPLELERIVLRLLARNPEERYQTAESMLHELDPFLAQHRLWVSPKPLSKYMRMIFSDKVGAMDSALADGVTLSQHLANTATGQSASSELITPPSAFPAVVPLSQEMPAVRPSTDLPFATTSAMPSVTAPAEAPPAVADTPSKPVEYPNLKRGGGRLAFAILGALALGGGGYAAFELVQRDADSMPSAPPPAPPPAAPPVAEPSPPPPPPPSEPKPAEVKPVEEPAPVAKEEPKPAPKQQLPVEPTIRPKKVAAPPAPPPKHPPPKHTQPPPKVEKEQTEPKETPPPPPPKETKPKEKDPNWNLDSPFLPPPK
jgi:serine/threonine protein kinase